MKDFYHSNKGTSVKSLTVPERVDCTVWKNEANLLFFPKSKFLETEAEQQIDQKDNLMGTRGQDIQYPVITKALEDKYRLNEDKYLVSRIYGSLDDNGANFRYFTKLGKKLFAPHFKPPQT